MQSHMENSDSDRGTIIRIYVENFVTYDKVEIFPGSGLNVIIGPNGSGKSTIVSAIVLGLGGKPNVIGRGETVSTYVKNGRETATIEIELKDKDNKNLKITRQFNVTNDTVWKLNGTPVKFKDVKSVIDGMNIQVDNLCQLLPQDKVQDFAKMNEQQLLENTERSIGNPMLVEYHNQLKRLRKKSVELEIQITEKEGLLKTEMQKYEQSKDAVVHVKEKKAITKKIKTLTQKKAWIKYDMARKHLSDSKVERDAAAADMKRCDTSINSIQRSIKIFKQKYSSLETNFNIYNTTLSEKITKIKQAYNQALSFDQQLRNIEMDYQNAITKEENRDEEIRAVLQQISKLDNDLELAFKELGTESDLAKSLDVISQKIEKEKLAGDKIVMLKNTSKAEENSVNNQIRHAQNELTALNDVDSKRLKLLQAQSSDAFKAVMWLRQNHNQFNSKVWEPIMMNVNVKAERNTKYIENVIPYRDMLAFVCEDKQDMNRLMHILREENRLKINVVYSNPAINVNSTPNVPLDALRQFGFLDYLINLIEAPIAIMNYLIRNCNIHNIPVGTKAVDDNYQSLPRGIRLFFSHDIMYRMSISRYTGQKSFSSSVAKSSGMLSIILDSNKLHVLTEELKSFEIKKAKIQQNLIKYERDIEEMNSILETSRKTKNKINRDLTMIQNFRTKIKMAKDKIQKLEKERMSIEEITASTARQFKEIQESQLRAYQQYVENMSNCLKFISENHQTKRKLTEYRRKYSAKECELKEMKDKLAVIERRFKTLDECLRPLKEETQNLYAAALETTDQLSPLDKEFSKLQTQFAKLPATIQEIDAQLVDAKAKAYCMGNDAEMAKLLSDYEKSSASVKKLNDMLEFLKTEKDSDDGKIAELKPKWFPELRALVARINDNFKSYFETIECVGEVVLNIPACEDDYEAYGLQIRVKFRDTETLRELSRQHHSGGERAVTTAAYMIALQELSIVPFRCVDEINQGMDSINERRIFELIVKITGRENSCQYFLLTPKLLPGLNYGEKVTILCVYNGPFMVPSTNFNIDQFITRISAY